MDRRPLQRLADHTELRPVLRCSHRKCQSTKQIPLAAGPIAIEMGYASAWVAARLPNGRWSGPDGRDGSHRVDVGADSGGVASFAWGFVGTADSVAPDRTNCLGDCGDRRGWLDPAATSTASTPAGAPTSQQTADAFCWPVRIRPPQRTSPRRFVPSPMIYRTSQSTRRPVRPTRTRPRPPGCVTPRRPVSGSQACVNSRGPVRARAARP
jgi:hypothetical protein